MKVIIDFDSILGRGGCDHDNLLGMYPEILSISSLVKRLKSTLVKDRHMGYSCLSLPLDHLEDHQYYSRTHALAAEVVRVITQGDFCCCILSDFNRANLPCLVCFDSDRERFERALSRSKFPAFIVTNFTVVEESYYISGSEMRLDDSVIVAGTKDIQVLDLACLGLSVPASLPLYTAKSTSISRASIEEDILSKLTKMFQPEQLKQCFNSKTLDIKHPFQSVRHILASDNRSDYVSVTGIVIRKESSTARHQFSLRVRDLEYRDSMLLYLPLTAARGIIKGMTILAQNVKIISTSRHTYLLFKESLSSLGLCIAKYIGKLSHISAGILGLRRVYDPLPPPSSTIESLSTSRSSSRCLWALRARIVGVRGLSLSVKCRKCHCICYPRPNVRHNRCLVCSEDTENVHTWSIWLEFDDGTGRCGVLVETSDIVPLLRMERSDTRIYAEKKIQMLKSDASQNGSIDCADIGRCTITTLGRASNYVDTNVERLRWVASSIDLNCTFAIEGVVLNYKAKEKFVTSISDTSLITENIPLSKLGTSYPFNHIHLPTFVRPFISIKCTRIVKISSEDMRADVYTLFRELENLQHFS